MKKCLVLASGLLSSVLAAAGCGSPAPVAAVMAADLALYEGADRLQKLIDGAKQEGELTVYTSAQTDDLGPVIAAYEKKYGLKASIWRAGSEQVLNRALQESRAGRHTVDIVGTERYGARSTGPREGAGR